MKGYGPKRERETIIRFDDQSDSSEIWTASETVYRRLLKRLGRAYLAEDGERHAAFSCPKQFLQLPRIKQRKERSQAQYDQLIHHGKQLTEGKQANKDIPEGLPQ